MTSQFEFGGDIVWRPTETYLANSNLKQFMDAHGLPDFDALMEKSTQDIEWFWEAVLEALQIEFYEPYRQIVDLSKGIQWPRWCVGGKMNIVHNCLDKWMGTPVQNRVALRWEGEEGTVRLLSYRDLWAAVNQCANALRSLGLGKGDAIGLYMPMTPEIAIALLAIVKIGGIILPLFSGYGAGAIATRLADADAKLLFTCDGAFRRGKVVPMKPVADEALQHVPTVQHTVVLRRTGAEVPMQEGRDLWWHDFLSGQPITAPTEVTDAEDPLMIIYTSGTTGKPKGAVHTHCGFPIKSAQDMYHGLDLHPEDTLYWMTDMGWMMGPWEVFGTLILGATMLFYDGAPDYPDVDRVWALVERHGVTALGVAPTLIRALMPHGEAPVRRHNLDSLRLFGSTGEAWNPDPWLWLFNVVGEGKRPIINYSGGTEIAGGIVMGNVVKPLKPCAFSGPVPGMAADVVDEAGNSVRGEVGELVIRGPWIGMTRGFWKDPDRYLATYWSRFENVWVHGDFAAVDEDGLWYILGRSDDTIKVAGKRVGPAEVESVLVSHPAVTEAAAVGVPDPVKGQAVVAFCVLQPNVSPSDALKAELRALVGREMGKPLTPKAIEFVDAVPQTRNAKVMRRVIRAAYLGQDPGDLSALVNPEAVEAIRRLTIGD
ncbi:MAG: AMP-dependent synthetase [Caldilineae bacterium]|nr:MAG: AMP-dependent synthetase [Caldilineae bacterium]